MVIIAGLTATTAGGVLFSTASWTPRLALDLEGGTQIILQAQLGEGESISTEQLNQAVSIIRQRIDASGVSEAEISTQGAQNVVVSLPGVPDQATLDRIESSAKLEFRPVLYTDAASVASVGEEGDAASPSPEASDPAAAPLEATPSVSPTDASDLNWITPALFDQFTNFDCADSDTLGANVAPVDQPLVTCDDTSTAKFILGPVEVAGENISDATNGLVTNAQGISTGTWGVNIVFDGTGTDQFAAVTERLFALEGAQNQFAIVLDGRVISAPTTNAVITDGRPQISGSFTQDSSKALADQLKFGALPVGFEVLSRDTISATLGSNQLASGVIAGLVGLGLVLVYSLFQYRLLGLVTMASLVVAGVLTYLVLALMSWRQGFRLSLAGVAGLIVAIGFTADSFIVYFERIRDELRDGRSLPGAVEAGWKRALRTILASKGISLLSAVVLFVLAIGNVRGFALTLGVTVIIDIIVVMLFTHPMLQLLANTRFFANGHKLSGLDPQALGAIYRGRAQFREPVRTAKGSGASREAARRQTIAERKAAGTITAPADTPPEKSVTSSAPSKGKDS
ncbi:protein translocase subunit SecD [Marisediminicola senii]|uniref:protein translocase subunit SecD n=1 Tax=Marisediminicola senii TaxID=2711233 RepID=UPI0013EDC70B|nr:protein translocase subunit SecD [Marisediminicola senii]